MKAYKQLAYEQRCQIIILMKSDFKQQAIADAIGVNQGTISREFRRNAGERGFRQHQTQKKRTERRAKATSALKMTAELCIITSM